MTSARSGSGQAADGARPAVAPPRRRGPGRALIVMVSSTAWAFAIQLALVPRFARWMGTEVYGIVGLTTTIAAFAQLFDLGFGVSINRELARSAADAREHEQRLEVVATAEVVAWVIGGALALATFAASRQVVQIWLRLEGTSVDEASTLVRWGAGVLVVTWALPLYTGALAGLDRQVPLALLSISTNTLFAALAVVLLRAGGGAVAFLAARMGVGAVQLVCARSLTWRTLRAKAPAGARPRFRWASLAPLWGFSVAMTIVSTTGIFIMQFDKALASKTLPAAVFGKYMLAAAASGAMAQLVAPVFAVFYPRLSRACSGDAREVADEFRLFSQVLGAAVVPSSLALCWFSQPLVQAWTGSPELAAETGAIVAILTLGSLLNACMVPFYALQLARGWVFLGVAANVVMLLALLVFGALVGVGGDPRIPALAWPLANGTYLVVGTALTALMSQGALIRSWAAWMVAVPTAVTLVVLWGLDWLGIASWHAPAFALSLAGGVAVAFLASLTLGPESRAAARLAVSYAFDPAR